MSKALSAIEISRIPELVRIVEEVRKTNKPRILSKRKKPVAILRPLNDSGKRRDWRKEKADRDAFLASAGSWKDVDVDEFLKNIYESRRISSRPSVQL
jgi:hypothetical protein